MRNIIQANKPLHNIAYNNLHNKEINSILNNDNYIKAYLKTIIKEFKTNKTKNTNENNCYLFIDINNSCITCF